MKKLILSIAIVLGVGVPAVAFAAIPTLTVSPTVVAPGQILTMTLNTNEGRTWPTVWFTKGTSETALSSWAFPCFQMCTEGRVVTANYQIPVSWAAGTDYYAKVYDHVSGQYIKTNFAVEGSSDPNQFATVTASPSVVRPGQVLTISLQTNGTYVSSNIGFTKGGSATAFWNTSFPCSSVCTAPATAYFTVPKWQNGSDYYVNVYDQTNQRMVKVNFTVRR